MNDKDPRPTAFRPGVATLRCPSCGGTVAIRAPGQTTTVVCQSCGSCLDIKGTDVENIVKYEKQRVRSILPIGVRGTIREQIFEVIGLIVQNEDHYTWEEYLLFNPRIGFRWLVHDHGHWNFATPLPVAPVAEGLAFTVSAFEVEDKSYQRYHLGKATVSHVEGEFYWRVRRGDSTRTGDFIAPPFMLSFERGKDEINWSRLEYLDPKEVATGFKIESPIARGVAPNQPDPNEDHARITRWTALVALLAAFAVQILFAVTSPTQSVVRTAIPALPENPGQPIVLGPFDLKGRTSTMELTSYAPVNNTWVDIDAELLDEQTETSYEFTQTIEQYSGRDSDGSWSEGGPRTSSMIASVPPGKYLLLLQPSISSNTTAYQPFTGSIAVELKRNVTSWSTFAVVFVGLCLYPAWVFYRRRAFLKQRWENSEFTPYQSDDDE